MRLQKKLWADWSPGGAPPAGWEWGDDDFGHRSPDGRGVFADDSGPWDVTWCDRCASQGVLQMAVAQRTDSPECHCDGCLCEAGALLEDDALGPGWTEISGDLPLQPDWNEILTSGYRRAWSEELKKRAWTELLRSGRRKPWSEEQGREPILGDGLPADTLCGCECAAPDRDEELESRFWSKVQRARTDECWPWIGQHHHTGYARFRAEGKEWAAHRFLWELMHGPIPPKRLVLHKCDRWNCCNPAHLFLGGESERSCDFLYLLGKKLWADWSPGDDPPGGYRWGRDDYREIVPGDPPPWGVLWCDHCARFARVLEPAAAQRTDSEVCACRYCLVELDRWRESGLRDDGALGPGWRELRPVERATQ